MNWTGHVIAAPRSGLAALLKWDEVLRTGVYLLLGDDPELPGRQLAYIGEADDVAKRLYQHARDESKDFWDRAVVLTSKDTNLTKAHARYLESRFIALATRAGRARLLNGAAPSIIGLPKADVSDMEYFIEQARIVLPVLGVNLLRIAEVHSEPATATPHDGERSPILVLMQQKDGVSASAQEVDGEFTVRSGARARLTWTGVDTSYRKLRERLESDRTLRLSSDGTAMILPLDTVFASPSAAGAVLLGRNANGRKAWKVEATGETYGQWQDKQLDAVKV